MTAFQEFCTTHWPYLFSGPWEGDRAKFAELFDSFREAGFVFTTDFARGRGASACAIAAAIQYVAELETGIDATAAIVSRTVAASQEMLDAAMLLLRDQGERLGFKRIEKRGREIWCDHRCIGFFSRAEWSAGLADGYTLRLVDDWPVGLRPREDLRIAIFILKTGE